MTHGTDCCHDCNQACRTTAGKLPLLVDDDDDDDGSTSSRRRLL